MIGVAVVWDKWENDAQALSAVLSDNLKVQPERPQAFGYAGPNDVVMWIASFAEWKSVAIGLAAWLAGKVGDDVYDLIKQRLREAFGLDTAAPNVLNLPVEASQCIINTQEQGGDVLLAVRDEPMKAGDVIPRESHTVQLPPMEDTSGVALARCIIQFAVSIEAINRNDGIPPREILKTISIKPHPWSDPKISIAIREIGEVEDPGKDQG